MASDSDAAVLAIMAQQQATKGGSSQTINLGHLLGAVAIGGVLWFLMAAGSDPVKAKAKANPRKRRRRR